MQEITSNKQSSDWFGALQIGGIFLEDISVSLKWVGDTFEDGWLGPRNKYIHTVGNTANVKFVPTSNNKYTGVLAGADHGIIRLSAAKQPDQSKTASQDAYENFTPGFGLKFLRNNAPSANLVAMYGVDGQPSWNFFANEFSNHIPESVGVAQKALGLKF